MPGKHRNGTIGLNSPSNSVQSALGISDGKATMNRLRKLFAAPVYPTSDSTTEYDDTVMRAAGETLLFSPSVKDADPLLWPQGVDQTFSGAPNIPGDVPTGGGGLPATAYGPNTASPGPHADGTTNNDPQDLPDLKLAKGDNWAGVPMSLGIDGEVDPATTSAETITAARAGTQVLGGHGTTPGVKEIKGQIG